MKNKGIPVKHVKEGSIADTYGIKDGDVLLAINGGEINDVFDYDFYASNEDVLLQLLSEGVPYEVSIVKQTYEDLGLEFDSYMMDKEKRCNNKCVFCFVDQLPPGMRENLYFKDDDMRLSFLSGSYVTLTNMDDSELMRIVKYRLSPINVSVHTTNPDLRIKMLNNRFAGDVIRKIHILTDNGIEVNCQIVLCDGMNDREELDRTLSDLLELAPKINSISVVPVGITRYRKNLQQFQGFNRDEAIAVIKQIDGWQKRYLDRNGKITVYASDEFYVTAGLDFPGCEFYDDFPQLENGVGMISSLVCEIDEYLKNISIFNKIKYKMIRRNISIATGECAYDTIKMVAGKISSIYKGVKIDVYKIKNDFFGGKVTVTGLLTGQDIVRQLTGKLLGDELLLSYDIFKNAENMTLDDMKDVEIEKALNVKVVKVHDTGSCFVESVLGIKDGGV